MTKPAMLDKSWPTPPMFKKIKTKYKPNPPKIAYDLGNPVLSSNCLKI